MPMMAQNSDETMVWAYYYGSSDGWSPLGTGSTGQIFSIAYFVPGDGSLSGASINAVKIPVVESRMKNVKVWVKNVLNGDGRIEFKTDNRGLFEYSLCSMNEFGMHFDGVWLDLHDSEEAKENVMTEYEEKFSQKGQPIYKLTAHF